MRRAFLVALTMAVMGCDPEVKDECARFCNAADACNLLPSIAGEGVDDCKARCSRSDKDFITRTLGSGSPCRRQLDDVGGSVKEGRACHAEDWQVCENLVRCLEANTPPASPLTGKASVQVSFVELLQLDECSGSDSACAIGEPAADGGVEALPTGFQNIPLCGSVAQQSWQATGSYCSAVSGSAGFVIAEAQMVVLRAGSLVAFGSRSQCDEALGGTFEAQVTPGQLQAAVLFFSGPLVVSSDADGGADDQGSDGGTAPSHADGGADNQGSDSGTVPAAKDAGATVAPPALERRCLALVGPLRGVEAGQQLVSLPVAALRPVSSVDGTSWQSCDGIVPSEVSKPGCITIPGREDECCTREVQADGRTTLRCPDPQVSSLLRSSPI